MIKAEKGSVQLSGTRDDIIVEYVCTTMSFINEFSFDEAIVALAVAKQHAGEGQRTDMSNFQDLLDKLKDEGGEA